MKTQDALGSRLVERRSLLGRTGSSAMREASLLGAGALSLRSVEATTASGPILLRPVRRRRLTLELNRLNRFPF